MVTTSYRGGSAWSSNSYECKATMDVAVRQFEEEARKHGVAAAWIPEISEVIYTTDNAQFVEDFGDWKDKADQHALDLCEQGKLADHGCGCGLCGDTDQ